MFESYDKRVKKKRQAWEIYKALKKDDIYKSSYLYIKAYIKAKQILMGFHKDYTFKNTKITSKNVEKSINVLANMEITNGKTIELTDQIIGEFLEM